MSAEPPSVCDRFAVQVHALMFQQPSPKKQQVSVHVNRKTSAWNSKPRKEQSQWPTEESTSADSDAEDAESEVSRTISSVSASVGVSEAGCGKTHTAPVAHGSSDDGEEEEESAASSEDAIEALLEREGMQALLKRVPRDETGTLLTVGSIPHATGACKPCVFAHSERKTCQNGRECLFCHLPHAPKKRMRFCKKKRQDIKRLAHEQ